MSSIESRLMWMAIALSLLLVIALSTLAVYSVLGQGDDEEEADGDGRPSIFDIFDRGNDDDDDDPGGEGDGGDGSPASPSLDVGDVEPPLAVGCAPSGGSSRSYEVVITNRGDDTVDYIVAIELDVAGSPPVMATTEVAGLRAGERREVTVDATGPGGRRIADCSIAAVQSDRRVLLANS